MNDLVVNKIQSIQRCILRAREGYEADPIGFATNYSRQDAALLNVLRACETAIDLANHVIRVRKLGVPVSSADGFRLLHSAGLLEERLAQRMARMVGFRNTVVHQYREVDLGIVESVLTKELDQLLAFTDRMREASETPRAEPR
ncbi:MAG: DUF86 domain-containing protein [Fimbriimonadaceae bacterium]|nr:DUF86 domain-containing protein [Fimbriimonadaceae bacterium]